MSRVRPRRPSSRGFALGITGSLASGKSTVLEEFSRSGWRVLSADEVVHRLYASHNLKLDRLREEARQSEAAIRRLEKFIHPLVRKEIRKFMAKNAGRKAAVEIPLLFEAGWDRSFDSCVFIFCPKHIRMKRAMKRGMKKKLFERLDSRQLSAFEKTKRADFVLQNRKDKKHLRAQARALIAFLGSGPERARSFKR